MTLHIIFLTLVHCIGLHKNCQDLFCLLQNSESLMAHHGAVRPLWPLTCWRVDRRHPNQAYMRHPHTMGMGDAAWCAWFRLNQMGRRMASSTFTSMVLTNINSYIHSYDISLMSYAHKLHPPLQLVRVRGEANGQSTHWQLAGGILEVEELMSKSTIDLFLSLSATNWSNSS